MRALRTVLRPGWIALGVVVVAFAALCFSILAPWQLGKNSSTEHRNQLIKDAVGTAAVPLDQVTRTGAAFDPATEWREVTVTGRYLPDDQVLVRLRSVEDQPAVEVLVPFAVNGSDRMVLVDRGYVRPQQGSTTPAVPTAPSDEVTITARIRAGEGTSPGRGAHSEDGVRAVYTIDPGVVGTMVGSRLDPYYLQLAADQPGSLGTIGLPQLDSGPYLSYGLQWLAFGIMAPLGACYFVYSEFRQRRRRDPVDDHGLAAGSDEDGPTESDGLTASDEATGSENTEGSEKTPAGVGPDGSRRAGASPEPATAHPTTALSRRRRLRSDLQAAGTDSSAHSRGQIGAGPATQGSPAAVRDKLSKRYGN
ncbi:SURF1 family cytochrome oxidase biogenesis protein [Gordonia soli]|uniref:SURF1-like protein n=1 Tax=Gordonia soli NBRC 108243 TaxID=1223545 RepID=M0QPU3_9ACTN|nr:SURF1 family cytochrome oxidase biogenesis protein [Gordonia soli]GAC69457.1 hypothetical protein GS4_25_00280 [Gordonia soli NBRC 108243]